ncbi:hypothetical protein MKW94_023314 [Papaver nudicaule]|uniref:Eukaryotic translation initiation factor 3 subunit G n=1 Tax=Papaver nudicaule TaxID=74823 RepID=A0AA41VH91_PAPNU|nr:hypothetical protein [Papaver nudicaule]
MAISTQRKDWADYEEDDGGDFLLPPTEVIGPDKKGIKKVISYKYNDEGKKVKVTTTIRVTKTVTRTGRGVEERRSWPKFGAAADGNDGCISVSQEDIHLEKPTAPGEKPKEKDIQQAAGTGGGTLMVCRTCGMKGDHWTRECRYKNLAPNPADATSETSKDSDNNKGTKKYVAPRPDRKRREDEEHSIRVSNLSDDTRDDDLRDLFAAFGPVARARVLFDHHTGKSRGFGFVNFVHKEDGERAIQKLNGYGYDSLILCVEWAAPRSK